MSALRLGLFGEKLPGGGLSLVVGLFFQLLIDAPLVAKGIEDLSIACSPKKILHGHEQARASGYGTVDQAAGVFDLDRNSHAGSSQRLWRLERTAFAGFKLIAEEKLVTVQNDLAMHETPTIWRHHSVSFFSPKEVLVQLYRRQPVRNDQVGIKLTFSMHGLLLRQSSGNSINADYLTPERPVPA